MKSIRKCSTTSLFQSLTKSSQTTQRIVKNTSINQRNGSVFSRQFHSSQVIYDQSITESSVFPAIDQFKKRHNAQFDIKNDKSHFDSIEEMLNFIGEKDIDSFIKKVIPSNILNEKDQLAKLEEKFVFTDGKINKGESEILKEFYDHYALKNQMKKSFIGMGYYNTLTPYVILRNVLENPGWYTSYTPYQAEIAQGRLENLLNFQTMVAELTGLPISNASLLDEGTSAAEAMSMCLGVFLKDNRQYRKDDESKEIAFVVDAGVHPQTIDVLRTRAAPINVKIVVSDDLSSFDFEKSETPVCGVLFQYPNSTGSVQDYEAVIKKAKSAKVLTVCATDLLALTVLKPPGEMGVDIAVGVNQRFGVPLGYGGPHAGFLAAVDEFKRQMPGRIIGYSKDANGDIAYRMALQTREQHIKRDRATSNICTAQALLANISAFYAIYHGPNGLKKIANQVHEKTFILSKALEKIGFKTMNKLFFDTIQVETNEHTEQIMKQAVHLGYNLRKVDKSSLGISFDETVALQDIKNILKAFKSDSNMSDAELLSLRENTIEKSSLKRTSSYLKHEVFNKYHTEHELLRYMKRLENRDISLVHSMIALGSCTMKLNATFEMIPISWKEFNSIHPFAPKDQTLGYQRMYQDLVNWLSIITGFDGLTLQPNSGAQGEYSGLMVIRKYHQSRGDHHRNICIIPTSAHGTNPASAVMAGMKVVVVKCDKHGNVDINDLKKQAEKHKDNLSSLMVTYPSTHGVYEEQIQEICKIIHDNGGQVYMDGANMNAQVGLTSPGFIGADVCHLNLHKTFCIPHGGGGPGMGPIGVKKHLIPFLPDHSVISCVEEQHKETASGAVSSAPWGSSSILPISWMFIRGMGAQGLIDSTKVAILNANYMAKRLKDHYQIVYSGANGYNAHEFIIDINPYKKSCGIEAEDVAKRLMDYGFHSPTMSFPITNTLMIEPTESETKEELDRFCDAMISIREEIREIEEGKADKKNNVLKNSPHTAKVVLSDKWDKPYSREKAVYPAEWLYDSKFWPHVSRIDSAYGDMNLMCTCAPIESYLNNEKQ